ncbi:MAG: hypothetical protein GY952_08045 [Rhodobacteraceae bacterium]|nr:hypothetical protein [Paracoccaceae bacterium]
MEFADAALAVAPDLTIARLMRARCLALLGETEAARDAYLAVLERDAKNFSAHLELGNIWRRLSNRELATASYQRAVACRRLMPRLTSSHNSWQTKHI